MRIIVTGGTGNTGRPLCATLVNDGHEVIVLTRSPERNPGLPPAVQLVGWDAKSAQGWGSYADGADAIINLAAENLAGTGVIPARWSAARKQRIYTSRIAGGQAIVEAVTAAQTKPKVLIQASGVNYYGTHRDEVITEASGPGADFLAHVCFDWEATTAAVERQGVRRAIMRSGMVLTNTGGAWPRIVLPFKLFVGGPLGSGKQYWSWIHIEDEVRAIIFLLNHADAHGAFNLTAPEPLPNRAFAAALGAVMHRPAFFPVPAFVLRTLFGEMSTVLLDGQRAIPKHLLDLGFTFTYPTAPAAFGDLVG
jgi:uncharacterized protein (TIGR01777 family)